MNNEYERLNPYGYEDSDDQQWWFSADHICNIAKAKNTDNNTSTL